MLVTTLWSKNRTVALLFQPYTQLKHAIKKEYYIVFLKTLNNRFFTAGDYNAKHIYIEIRSN